MPDEKVESGSAADPAFLHAAIVLRPGKERQGDGFLPEYTKIRLFRQQGCRNAAGGGYGDHQGHIRQLV